MSDSNSRHTGEFELIRRLTQQLPSNQAVALGIGDDCAVLDVEGGQQLLVTCDSQVEGVHFLRHFSSPEQIGRKALAANLSDIAAMGGQPRFALISLILPQQPDSDFLAQVYTGLQLEAAPFQVAIVGGNLAGSGPGEQLIIDITIIGLVARGGALLRSGACNGDLLCVTGMPGEAAAGLYTLFHPELAYPSAALEKVRSRCRTPQPRVEVGQVLQRFGPEIITSLLDISDGLSGDLAHICERSKVGARVLAPDLPISEEVQSIARIAGCDPLEWVLHGGEDYELLFSVSPAYVEQVRESVYTETGVPVAVIGMITSPGEGLKLAHSSQHVEELRRQSWDHLAPSS